MDTAYARSGDHNIAYQTRGVAGTDLLVVPGFVSHVELTWDDPHLSAFFSRLASFTRLVLFDKRGTGLSDRVPPAVPIEDRIDDVRAVLDASGVRRATLLGISEGGPMAIAFAAMYPHATSGLILYGATARFLADPPSHPWGMDAGALDDFASGVEATWGTPDMLGAFAPSLLEDDRAERTALRYLRSAASPGAAADIIRWWGAIDVRAIASTIKVPTLVLHRRDDPLLDVDAGRHLATLIPDAEFVELPGSDHPPWYGEPDPVIDQIERFLTGSTGSVETDRTLATLLFTDIVGSTNHAEKVGDANWRRLLDHHDRLVALQLEKFRGRQVKQTGDGFLAVFDGPARAIRCALAIQGATRALGLPIRAGVHTGEVEERGEDISGIAVHIAARVMAAAPPGTVLVSGAVPSLVAGSGLCFDDHGTHELKGVRHPINLYAART